MDLKPNTTVKHNPKKKDRIKRIAGQDAIMATTSRSIEALNMAV